MSPRNDDNQALKQKDLLLILAIAGRIDAQNAAQNAAKNLDKNRTVYYGYAALDSLSSSYSMFKYFFDIFISNNDPDAMHSMMLTPGGILAITLESIFLVTFAVLATKFEKDLTALKNSENEEEAKKNYTYKAMIAANWPYFRDVMKGLKNAYKGWRSAIVAINLVGGVDLKFLIIPVGLVLGIFAAANRYWYRSMVDKRKAMMLVNDRLKEEMRALANELLQDQIEVPSFLIDKEISRVYENIQRQALETRIGAFFSAALGGFVDGLYLYVGVLALAALSSPLLYAMSVLCVLYTLGCIITRVNEEYEFQLKLFITQTKCELEVNALQVQLAYTKFISLQQLVTTNPTEIALAKQTLLSLLQQFETNRQLLNQQLIRTFLSAALLGVRNGLYAYGALASIVFLVSSILTLASVAFPPALLVICVSMGVVFMVGFIAHSLKNNYQVSNQEKLSEASTYQQIITLNEKLNSTTATSGLSDVPTFRQALNDGLTVNTAPQKPFQEWFEVFRSLFSGFGKGQKFVDFAANPLQEQDAAGHYHDSKVMHAIAVISSLIFGITLALRALAKGFKPKDKTETKAAVIEKEPQPFPYEGEEGVGVTSSAPPAVDKKPKHTKGPAPKTQRLKELSKRYQTLQPDSLTRATSQVSNVSFFKGPAKQNNMPRSRSDNALSANVSTPSHTVQGLN